MTFRRFAISVDMDEVLVNLFDSWLDDYNTDYHDDLTRDRIKGWAVHEYVKPECGEKIYDYLGWPGFFYNLEPMPGAIESLLDLRSRGHDIILCTATPSSAPTGFHEKREWIKKHIPDFDTHSFVSTHRKDLIIADILIDDGIHNLRSFPNIAVAVEKPWNKLEKQHADAWATDWSEVMEIIGLLEDDDEVYYDILEHSSARYLDSRPTLWPGSSQS